MRHILSCLVENRFGVLARVAGMFSARGFNIDSLCVGETLDPEVSHMTIVVTGNDAVLEQVTKQLNKMINVIEVKDFLKSDFVERELVLVRIKSDAKKRGEIAQIVDIFDARIIDVTKTTMIVEMGGGMKRIKAMTDLLEPYGVIEFVRTGYAAMERG